MPAEEIRPNGSPTSWTRGVQLALACLLSSALTLLAVRFIPALQRPLAPRPLDSGVDINRASKAELQQLPHVTEKRADAIIEARNSRGGFAQPDDLRSVKGVGPKRQAELIPHVKFDGEEQFVRPAAHYAKKEAPTAPIAVNRADAAELMKLPGVGPVLAARIVAERDKGPFTKVEDLRRVSGIGPKTIEKIRGLVKFE